MNNNNLTIIRVLDAPIDKVWQAWTNANEVCQWWGPKGVTNTTCEWDPQPGKQINIVMLAGEELGELAGQEWPMTGKFQEVVPMRKLVFTGSPLMDGKPVMETVNTVLFEDLGLKTKLTIQITVTNTTPEAAGPLAGMEAGWEQQTDKLAEYLRQRGANYVA